VVTPTAPGSGFDLQTGLAVQRDGKIVVGGESLMAQGGWQWRLTRYERDGGLDKSFGANGTVLLNMTSTAADFLDERLVAVAVQHDGKIVAAGFVQSDAENQNSALARFNPDGALDPTFGDGGRVIVDIAPSPDHDFFNAVLIDGAGNIVVGGGCRRLFVARFRPNGTLDPSFNAAGPRPGVQITEALAGEANAEILGTAFDPQGRIVGAGYSSGPNGTNSAVVRFLPDGTLDPSFNPAGPRPGVVITSLSPTGGFDVAFRVAVDRKGMILTAGDAFVGVGAGLYDIVLSRLLPDGSPDGSFGTGGRVYLNAGPGDSDDDVQGLVIQPNGKILVGGSAAPTAFRFDSDFMVARLLPDGAMDASFGQGGIAVTPTAPGGADDEIWAMDLQTPSMLVASGECDQPTTGRDVCVVRYKVSGGE
jgi:uncharacterized delta-60 repeat protein